MILYIIIGFLAIFILVCSHMAAYTAGKIHQTKELWEDNQKFNQSMTRVFTLLLEKKEGKQ